MFPTVNDNAQCAPPYWNDEPDDCYFPASEQTKQVNDRNER